MSLDALSKQLRVPSTQLDYLNGLSDDELVMLQAQLAAGRKTQHAHVNQAMRAAVDQLPRLMRKPVLKMFEGL